MQVIATATSPQGSSIRLGNRGTHLSIPLEEQDDLEELKVLGSKVHYLKAALSPKPIQTKLLSQNHNPPKQAHSSRGRNVNTFCFFSYLFLTFQAGPHLLKETSALLLPEMLHKFLLLPNYHYKLQNGGMQTAHSKEDKKNIRLQIENGQTCWEL